MEQNSKLKHILLQIRDVIEIVLPTIAFIVMFLVFVVQVLARYVFKNPLTWAYEITVTGFAWTVIFGACYAMRHRTHVTFTMIYDAVPPKVGALLRLLGNLLIIVGLAILILPSYRYLHFVAFQKTAVFRIPLSFIYCPFVYFLCAIIGYTIIDVLADIRFLTGKTPASEAH